MPDIREILAALDPDDRAIWIEHRTNMRRSYLNAHNNTTGLANWLNEDDAFLDLIDIRLALLFDRSGRLHAIKPIIGKEEGEAIEQKIRDAVLSMKLVTKEPVNTPEASEVTMSDASKMLEGWK